MLDGLGEVIQAFIYQIGYVGIFLLMVAESTFIPIPSVLVMPFAGSLCVLSASQAEPLSLPLVILMNSLGALVGSWAFYEFGARGGKPILVRYGRWVFIRQSDIEKTEAFFSKKGRLTVFIARFIPVVRHFISFVAGIGKMPRVPFLIQTVAGATIWGGSLAVAGYILADHWQDLTRAIKRFDLVIGLSIIGLTVALALRFYLKRRREAAS